MKLSWHLSLLVLLSLLLAACAAPVAPAAPAGEATAAAAGEAAAGEPVALQLSFWGSDLDSQVYQQRVDQFTAANPDIAVELVYIPSDYSQKVQTMIAGGTAPDILQLAEDIHSYSSKGQIIPLDDFIAQDQIDLQERYGATGGLTAAYSRDGKLYAMPDRGGALILYYNKDMFDQAGVAYPTPEWTWADFLDAAQKLTVRDGDTVTQYGFAAGGWWPWWMSFIYQNGGAVLDASGQPVVNSPEAVEAIQFYNDLVYNYKVAPSPEDYANLGTNSPDPLFAQGKVAMSMTGFWGIGGLKDATFNWDIAPLFQNKQPATVLFGSGLAISKDAENPAAAWKLIEYLTSEEGQAPIIENKQDAPANISSLNSDAFMQQSWSAQPINMAALGQSADAAFALPLSPKWNEMMTVFDTELGEVFANRSEVQPAMDRIQEQLAELFAE